MSKIEEDMFRAEDRLRNNISQKDLEKLKTQAKDEYDDVNLSLLTMSDETLAIVAKIAGIPFETAKSARLAYAVSKESVSLDMPEERLIDKNFGSPFKATGDTLIDRLDPYSTADPDLLATPTLEEEVEKEEQRKVVRKFLKILTPREEAIIRARFGFDDGSPKTLETIGKTYHVTRERIRQIEAAALKKLKRHIQKSVYKDII